jgi:hypothetical protein
MKRILLTPTPTDGGGAGGGTPPAAAPAAPSSSPGMDAIGRGDTPAAAPPTPTPSATPTPTPASAPAAQPPTAPSADDIAAATLRAAKELGWGAPTAPATPTPAAPAQSFTQEDFDRVFHVVRPNKAQVAQMLGIEEVNVTDAQVATITELHHASARQAAVMASYLIQQVKDELMQQYSPVLTHYRAAQEQQLMEEFTTAHPELKGFDLAVKHVTKELTGKGLVKGGMDKKSIFKLVADETLKFIRALPGMADAGKTPAAAAPPAGGGTAPTPTPQPASKMSSVSAGGQHGAGGTPAGQGAKSGPRGMEVFD